MITNLIKMLEEPKKLPIMTLSS